jgi:RNA polymerase sigma factor (TIGR02999 family)
MQPDITGLLRAWAGGDSAALNELTPLVYDQLLSIARRYIRRQKRQTLQTTALVHEAYLRLTAAGSLSWQNRAHFFAVAAQMMRRILVDAARARSAAKRRGDSTCIAFSEDMECTVCGDANLIAVDDALTALADIDPRKARVVELRFFGGLTVEETAEVLKVSADTVMRDWRLAKPWLAREIALGQHHAR